MQFDRAPQFDHECAPSSTGVSGGSSGASSRGALVLLGYYVMAVLVLITLLPFNFMGKPEFTWTFGWDPFDAPANVCLFIPVGALLAAMRPEWRVRHVVFAGFALSFGVEFTQAWLPGRVSTFWDLITNSLGSGLGATLLAHMRRSDVGRTIRRLALDLPLTLLAGLLTPVLWLNAIAAQAELARLWLGLPIALALAHVLVNIWRFRLARRLSGRSAIGVFVAWMALALGPAVLLDPIIALSIFGLSATLVALQAKPAVTLHGRERRFEGATLRPVLWLLGVFLMSVTVWPMPWDGIAWSANAGFAEAMASRAQAFRLLEYVGVLTVTGYALAESRGRVDAIRNRLPPTVVTGLLALVLALEGLHGVHPTQDASVLRLSAGFLVALYGVAVYRMQLLIVRSAARRASHTRPARPPGHAALSF